MFIDEGSGNCFVLRELLFCRCQKSPSGRGSVEAAWKSFLVQEWVTCLEKDILTHFQMETQILTWSKLCSKLSVVDYYFILYKIVWQSAWKIPWVKRKSKLKRRSLGQCLQSVCSVLHNTLIPSEMNFSLLHCIYSLKESLRFESKVVALLCFTEIHDLC